MGINVVKQVADVVSKLSKEELSELLSEEQDKSVVINADNVSLDDVELHSPEDEEYYDVFVDIAERMGWCFSDWNLMSKGNVELNINSIYIVGDFEDFITKDGSYWDIDTGKARVDLERKLLQNIEGGKYSLINIKKAILDKNIDCISKLLQIDEDVDMDDSSGNYFYCTFKESLETMSNPYDCLKYFPDRDSDVKEVEISPNASRAIKVLYRNMVDGFFVMDSIGYKVFGYDYSGFCSYIDRDSLTRFEVRTGLSGYSNVVIVQNKGKVEEMRGYSYGNTLLVM